MKRIGFSAIIASVFFLLQGCGGGAVSPQISMEGTNIPIPHKITRVHIDYFNGAHDYDTTYHIEEENDFIDFKIKHFINNPLERHIQFYLDTDNSGSTGYNALDESGIGAEYLIEDNAIYRYTGSGALDWSWKFISYVDDTFNQQDDYTRTIKLSKNLIDTLENNFMTKAVIFEPDWIQAVYTDNKRYITMIDKEFNKEILKAPEELPYHVFLYENKHALIFQSTLDNHYKDYHIEDIHRQFFIDIDNNEQTGYAEGFEYLLEDDKIYIFTGTDATWEWKWQEVDSGFISRLSLQSTSTFLRNSIAFIQPEIRIKTVFNSPSWQEIYSEISDVTLLHYEPQVRRVSEIEGYTVPSPECEDAYVICRWQTEFIDILQKYGYALGYTTFSGGPGLRYEERTYLSVLNLENMQNPDLTSQIVIKKYNRPVEMLTTNDYLYIITEHRPDNYSGNFYKAYLSVVDVSDKNNPVVLGYSHTVAGSNAPIYAKNFTIQKANNLLIIKYLYEDSPHMVIFDVSDPENPVKL